MPSQRRSICIIGAGAAGLTLGRTLADRGWRVRILEGGTANPPAALEDTFRAHVIGVPHRGVHEGRFRALGGSTTRWGGQLWPWEPSEFAARVCPVVAGWPIGYGDVAAYYASAFASLGIPAPTLQAAEAIQRGVVPPPLDPQRFTVKFSTWLPWRLRNLARTVGAPLGRHPNVTIHLGTTATRVVIDGTGHAREIETRTGDGSSVRFAADRIVLAGGAVENSRLLLLSDIPGAGPEGWLGRGFMDHLSVRVGRFHPRNDASFAQMFAPVFVRDVQHTPRIVLARELLERECLLGAYGHWDVQLPADSGLLVLREKLRALQSGSGFAVSARDIRRVLAGARDAVVLARGVLFDRRRYYPRGAQIHLRIDTEQQPDRDSRIVLTDERDVYGLPRVALDWRVSASEQRTVIRAAQLLAHELEERGIGSLESIGDPFDPARPWGELRGDSFHMMGGTRMATRAGDGVVDTDSRVFGVDNLYVAGASVFPTGGMANPTLTLIALTLRLADHLDEQT